MAKGNGLIHLSLFFVFVVFSLALSVAPVFDLLLCKHCLCVCVHEFLVGFCFSQKIESLHSFGLCLFVTEPRARNTCNIKFSGCRMPMNILDRFRVIISTLRARSFFFFFLGRWEWWRFFFYSLFWGIKSDSDSTWENLNAKAMAKEQNTRLRLKNKFRNTTPLHPKKKKKKNQKRRTFFKCLSTIELCTADGSPVCLTKNSP